MITNKLYYMLTYAIATVWAVNGLVCKILNLVPRHELIVASILGEKYSRIFTALIGVAEVVMAFWILSRFMSRLNAITQMIVIATMNVMEYLLVPDLLLWGKLNSIFAIMFIGLIYYNEFVLGKPYEALDGK